MTVPWNEVTIFWNEVTVRWNEMTWNELTMERSDRIPPNSIKFNFGATTEYDGDISSNFNSKILW